MFMKERFYSLVALALDEPDSSEGALVCKTHQRNRAIRQPVIEKEPNCDGRLVNVASETSDTFHSSYVARCDSLAPASRGLGKLVREPIEVPCL